MESEWNLSDKIRTQERFNQEHSIKTINVSDFIWKSDVREFIKRLKDISIDPIRDGISQDYEWLCGCIHAFRVFNKQINKIAGEKLI